MQKDSNSFEKLFGVITRGQTYLNYIYLFLAFPLGLIYFIFLTVGLSVGIATIIIWVGLLILLLTVGGWWLLAGFERVMAISLLKVDIPPMSTPKSEKAQTSLQKLGAFLSNPVTWKSLIYLFAKFPLGIFSFVVVVSLTALTLGLVTAPITYRFLNFEVTGWTGTIWVVDTLGEAVAAAVIGFFLFFLSLHIFNALAWVSGKFAQVMLGNTTPKIIAAEPVAGEDLTQAATVSSVLPVVDTPEPQNEELIIPANSSESNLPS